MDSPNDSCDEFSAPAHWQETVSNSVGWVVETRMKIQTVGDPLGNVRIWINDNVNLTHFDFSQTGVSVTYPDSRFYGMNTTDDFHVYRFEGLGSDIFLYVDGTLALAYTNRTWSGGGTPGLIFGDMHGSGPRSLSQWDYFLYDTFVPVEDLTDIKVNGSDGPVTLASSGTLSATIQLDPDIYIGQSADWWVLAYDVTGDVWYQYVSPFTTTSWQLWNSDPSAQGPLFALPSYEVLQLTGPAAGWYDFYFGLYLGLDVTPDGLLDFGTLYYDSVTVNVTP
jgi:hypothetical protein